MLTCNYMNIWFPIRKVQLFIESPKFIISSILIENDILVFITVALIYPVD